MNNVRLLAGLEALRHYENPLRITMMERFWYVDVLWESLDKRDSRRLSKLGWCAVDDWVGFVNESVAPKKEKEKT